MSYEETIKEAAIKAWFEHAMATLTQREIDEAARQHERMLQETWNQLDQDEQAIEEFCND